MSEKELENIIPETEETVTETEVKKEAVEEIVEEAIEETTEDASEITDEIVETAQEVYADADEVLEDGEVNGEEAQEVIEELVEKKKKSKAPFVVIAVVIVLAIVAALVYNFFGGNPYNKLGYANPSGRTIADVSEELGLTLDEFLTNYNLPADMPADTEEMNAYYSMPAKVFAQMYGIDFPTMKEAFGIPDETTPTEPKNIVEKIKLLFGGNKIQTIDENTPWGIVLDELALGNYIGEENIASFVEYYGLTGEITAETKYKEIREQVEKKTMELAAQQEADKTEEESETVEDAAATADEPPVTEETAE